MKKALNQIVKWALALLVSVPFVCSCNNKTDSSVPPELAVVTNPMGPRAKIQFLHVQASGDWSITIEYPEDQPAEWASVTPSTGTGNKSVTLKVEYYAGVQARKACIVLTAGSKKAELVLTQNGRSGGGGNLNPSTGWMELPAMPKDSKYDFFSHDMKIGNVTTRNYTYAWDYANLVAPWVAYPLCKWNIGDNINRKDRDDPWAVDPYLSEKQQPVLYMRGFKSTSSRRYDRGHQLPSADRLYDYSSNDKTFYGTNMTPQLSKLNQYFWKNLENKVRSWAYSSDTCYVVTGCLTDGSTEYALDNVGKKITVPSHYYKAVLRYSKSTTLGFAGYMGCAILLEHRDYGNGSNFKEYAISIDELEKKTGIDFYPNLSKLIGMEAAAKVESQDPKTINWWWN